MKKVIITNRWGDTIESTWKGSLIATLKDMNNQTMEDDNPGFFFEVEDADQDYIKSMVLPIFVNKHGVYLAPVNLTIVDKL